MKTRSICAIVIAGWSCTAGIAQHSSTAETFARAVRLQGSGDFKGAIAAYREVLAANPGSFETHANLGAALAHQGEYSDAIAEYQEALKTAPPAAIAPIRQNVGLALYKSGKLGQAAKEFDAVHQLQPAQRNAILLEADCYLRLGDFKRVIELLRPLDFDGADDRAVSYMLGMALIRSGQPHDGQALVDRLLRSGDSPEAHYLLGSVAFMAKDYPAAVKEFRSAADANPDLPSIYSYYGRALLFSGDPDAAADAFRKQLAADPNDFDANLQLAEILRYKKDLPGAEPLYRKAVVLRADSVEARYGLALSEITAGRFADAKISLEALLRDAPQFAEAHRSLATVYEKLGRSADARRETRSAADIPAGETGGIAPGAQAPDFALLAPEGNARVRLSAFRGHKPAVVVFGSYTCPKFRSQVDALNRLFDRYHEQAGFLLVYIREAHGDSSWQSTANERAGVSLPDASSLQQKRTYASRCLRNLKIRYPAVVDDMDGATEAQWSAFPSRVYLVDRSGKVVFNSLLDQQRFDAGALETALRHAIR